MAIPNISTEMTATQQACQAIQKGALQALRNNRWTYFFSRQSSLVHDVEYVMQIKQPEGEQLFDWLEKVITAGQAGCVVVESLRLPAVKQQALMALCHKYSVLLVAISPEADANNLVRGPW